MKKPSWEFKLGVALILFSIAIYAIKFLFLGDPQNSYFYVFNALGFLPINVLLVTIILNQLLIMRSRKEKLEKLNMVIGTFFSEAGTKLLSLFSDADPNLEEIRNRLIVNNGWSDEEFSRVHVELKRYNYTVDIKKMDFTKLGNSLRISAIFFCVCSRTLPSLSTLHSQNSFAPSSISLKSLIAGMN